METNRKVILRAHGLHKTFYRPIEIPIIKGIDLTVSQGETIAITGRSGEGKSTLLQLLGTLEKPSKGTLEIADQKVTAFNQTKIRNRHLAFIFQSFHLLEDYTALENVLMPARIARQSISPGSSAYRRANDLLGQVGLEGRAHFHTKLLSGGEKQRVAIARALCNDPDLILADEPSGNLDKQTAAHIHTLLLNFAREGKKSLIIVTHDPDLAHLCETQYVLTQGNLQVVN
jgi:lipoprotein-releasing system ATP-binding protein